MSCIPASQRLAAFAILFTCTVAWGGLPGCGGKREPEENQAATHLRKITAAYHEFNYRHGRSPQSADQLKPILKEMNEQDDPDVLLRSPNDGEPYEIVWGINLERVTDGSLLVAYEKKGVDGKRYAINAARIVKQVTDAEMGKASPPRGKRSAGGQ